MNIKLTFKTLVCLLTALDMLVDKYQENLETSKRLAADYASDEKLVSLLREDITGIEGEIEKAVAAKEELTEAILSKVVHFVKYQCNHD